ncbi:MAG: TetR/AcrR family transcriptional regulator C-terminal domain-containing protein [Pseudonocardiaceae bacterium]
MYRQHPWLSQISTIRPPLGPGLMAGREYLLSALSRIGLTPRQVTAAAATIAAFVDASASLETDSEQLERTTGQSNDAWWHQLHPFWDKYFDMDRYPAMVQVWNAGGFAATTAVQTAIAYEFGFERLLDGIEFVIDPDGT